MCEKEQQLGNRRKSAAGITVYLPKPMTSGINAKGRFGKQGLVYVADDDVYLCPAGERLHNPPASLEIEERE
jgi:hypothetical protein